VATERRVTEDTPAAGDAGEDAPDVLFTSLVGSKGLSAEHVFIVGMNNKHFPRNPGAVTDDEICSLIVALSRTRQRCHVISFRFFGAGGLARASSSAGSISTLRQ
jgi:superfamily I DNA/RNA helicase